MLIYAEVFVFDTSVLALILLKLRRNPVIVQGLD
jgi:hypothetical protein